ncbi:hypothetical protein BDR22DRAFT_816449 [Usnea florida]
MALRTRKSVIGDLRRVFSNDKKPDVPALPQREDVDIPVSALRVSRYGLVQELQTTYYRATDKKFIIGKNYYNIPRCMQPSGTNDLDPAICRVRWEFKKEYAINSTPSKLESFMGTYSIWFKDLRTAPDPKFLSQVEGDFWMMKQWPNEPIAGDKIEWVDIPRDMLAELNKDWWATGVLIPDIDTVATEEAERRRALRDIAKSAIEEV